MKYTESLAPHIRSLSFDKGLGWGGGAPQRLLVLAPHIRSAVSKYGPATMSKATLNPATLRLQGDIEKIPLIGAGLAGLLVGLPVVLEAGRG